LSIFKGLAAARIFLLKLTSAWTLPLKVKLALSEGSRTFWEITFVKTTSVAEGILAVDPKLLQHPLRGLCGFE